MASHTSAIHQMRRENAAASLEWMVTQHKLPAEEQQQQQQQQQEKMPGGMPMDMDEGFPDAQHQGPAAVEHAAPTPTTTTTSGVTVVSGPLAMLGGPLKEKALSVQLPIVDLFGLTLDGLTDWSRWNKATIDHAKAKQVFGGKDDIDWQTAFLPFMESIVMYMRDVSLHRRACYKFQAFLQARDRNDGAADLPGMKKDAVDDFVESTRTIQDIADLWGMDFQVLCNLPGHHPAGQPDWDGPYCGLFTSRRNDPKTGRPFQGIAFKGTNPISPAQWMVDFNYQDSGATTADAFLAGTTVSQGVRTSLFGVYDSPTLSGDYKGVPYNRIRDLALKSAKVLSDAAGGAPTVTHVTGHSLGASYATLCNAQLLLDLPGGAAAGEQQGQSAGGRFVQMGDTYTFGSPRVGGRSWARWYQDLVDRSKGRTWRVVNSDDLVPTVPPTSLQAELLDFHHVDGGVQVFPHSMLSIFSPRKFKKLPSEIDMQNNPPAVAFNSVTGLVMDVKNSVDHLPTGYYSALQAAMKQTSHTKPSGRYLLNYSVIMAWMRNLISFSIHCVIYGVLRLLLMVFRGR